MKNATKHAREKSQSSSVSGFAAGWKQAVTMRQYGNNMMTPAVWVWLSFAWIIVFSMSLIEATVWSFVSQYFVAESMRWLAFFLGPLFFIGIFGIVSLVPKLQLGNAVLEAPASH